MDKLLEFVGIKRQTWTNGTHSYFTKVFGVTFAFGWAGNLLTPCVHTQFHRFKGDVIGLIRITLRTGWTESDIFIRMGQEVPVYKSEGTKILWKIGWSSQHFILLCKKLKEMGIFGKLVEYKITGELESGDYFARGMILFISDETMM